MLAAATPAGLAIDTQNVYYTDSQAGAVMAVPVAGGAPGTLVQGLTAPGTLAVNSTSLFWLSVQAGVGSVMSAPLAGGTPSTLVGSRQNPRGLAASSTTVYWTDTATGGEFVKRLIAGGAVTPIATGLLNSFDVTSDATNVYALTDNGILAAPLAGGNVATIATNQANPGLMKVDATSVYWTTAGGVMKVAKLTQAVQ